MKTIIFTCQLIVCYCFYAYRTQSHNRSTFIVFFLSTCFCLSVLVEFWFLAIVKHEYGTEFKLYRKISKVKMLQKQLSPLWAYLEYFLIWEHKLIYFFVCFFLSSIWIKRHHKHTSLSLSVKFTEWILLTQCSADSVINQQCLTEPAASDWMRIVITWVTAGWYALLGERGVWFEWNHFKPPTASQAEKEGPSPLASLVSHLP